MRKRVINLQFFAGEKTEKPTPKRRREAREKGQVIRSHELTSAFLLLFSFYSLSIFVPRAFDQLRSFTVSIYGEPAYIEFTVAGVHRLFLMAAMLFAKVVWPFLLVAFIVALIGTLLQVGVLFTSDPLKVKLSRINPIEGFKRLFSMRTIIELVKSLGKVAIIIAIVYFTFRKEIKAIPAIMQLSLSDSVKHIGTMVTKLAASIAMALISVGAVDYFYQWWDHEKNLRMSKQEIREEMKQTEGNPEIRARQRELQRASVRRRMMQEVPKADVIVTNPTHYAVALKYDESVHGAPIVIAKGRNYIAEKIKEIGREKNIPIVENVFVAQSLYKSVEIGDQIPEELFQAVAEILAFVYRLQNRK